MKYYSTQRPIGPGSIPMNVVIKIVNFDYRKPVPKIGRPAWGYVVYDRELTQQEARSYELFAEK